MATTTTAATTTSLPSSVEQAFSTLTLSRPIRNYVCPARRTGASQQASKPSTPEPSSPALSSVSHKGTPSPPPSPPVDSFPAPIWRRSTQPSGSSPRPEDSSQGTKPARKCSPPRGRAQQSTNWRNSSPTAVPPAAPQPANVHPGQVYKLPSETDVSPDSIFQRRMALRSDKPWKHPLVVLEVRPCGIARCHLLGSIGGKRLQNRRPHEQLKIALCENDEGVQAHAGTRILTMAPGLAKFQWATYCNFHTDDGEDGSFLIEISNLHKWSTGSESPITLSQESVERIKNKQVY